MFCVNKYLKLCTFTYFTISNIHHFAKTHRINLKSIHFLFNRSHIHLFKKNFNCCKYSDENTPSLPQTQMEKIPNFSKSINLLELINFSEKNIEYLEITHKIELKDLEFLKKKYDISCKWHPNYYYLGGQLKVFKDEQITDKLIHEAEKAVEKN